MSTDIEILVVVHPGSACGSASFNIGNQDARAARASLVNELNAWLGPLVVIDGRLSIELPDYPALSSALENALARARQAGHMSLRLTGDDPEQNGRIRKVIESMGAEQKRAAFFNITGGWFDKGNGGGCVGGVYDVIVSMGCKANVCDSALCYAEEDDENDEKDSEDVDAIKF